MKKLSSINQNDAGKGNDNTKEKNQYLSDNFNKSPSKHAPEKHGEREQHKQKKDQQNK